MNQVNITAVVAKILRDSGPHAAKIVSEMLTGTRTDFQLVKLDQSKHYVLFSAILPASGSEVEFTTTHGVAKKLEAIGHVNLTSRDNKMYDIQKMLDDFYIELGVWIGRKMPEHRIFRSCSGICYNLSNWNRYVICLKYKDSFIYEMSTIFQDDLKAHNLDIIIPFNIDYQHFTQEENDNEIYQNPARLKWIREHAFEALKQQRIKTK